jgi:hypothetical protein
LAEIGEPVGEVSSKPRFHGQTVMAPAEAAIVDGA